MAFAGRRYIGSVAPSAVRPDIAARFGPTATTSGFTLIGAVPDGASTSDLRLFALRDGDAHELTTGSR